MKLLLISAALLASASLVGAQSPTSTSTSTSTSTATRPADAASAQACPTPQALQAGDLVGDWTVSWQAHPVEAPAAATNPASTNLPSTTQNAPAGSVPPSVGQIRLQRNPDYPESLVGVMFQGKLKHLLAGDVDEGLFTLEESTDGQHISANWVGRFQARDCGRSVSGNWLSATGNQQWAFTLRRNAGW